MSLDAAKTDAELLAMLESKQGRQPVVRQSLRSGPKGDYTSRRRPTAVEHDIQKALFTWAHADATLRQYPELALYHAIPNGGHRMPSVAAKLKAEGVVAGVPDTCLPIARGGFSSLWIELKRPGGSLTPEQADWLNALTRHGNRVEICTSWESARDVLLDYLQLSA